MIPLNWIFGQRRRFGCQPNNEMLAVEEHASVAGKITNPQEPPRAELVYDDSYVEQIWDFIDRFQAADEAIVVARSMLTLAMQCCRRIAVKEPGNLPADLEIIGKVTNRTCPVIAEHSNLQAARQRYAAALSSADVSDFFELVAGIPVYAPDFLDQVIQFVKRFSDPRAAIESIHAAVQLAHRAGSFKLLHDDKPLDEIAYHVDAICRGTLRLPFSVKEIDQGYPHRSLSLFWL